MLLEAVGRSTAQQRGSHFRDFIPSFNEATLPTHKRSRIPALHAPHILGRKALLSRTSCQKGSLKVANSGSRANAQRHQLATLERVFLARKWPPVSENRSRTYTRATRKGLLALPGMQKRN